MILTDVLSGKSVNKHFDVMTYLFGVTEHIKYVMPIIYTL